ncbi:putative Tubulin polyglutamylase TTLL13 [Blattamonas nauphoetae]|uniref:Tubulin polyglutamylase TTLL13 n=1 Tax=Blattamonas nauphoetae TaxID=2049346 RepID=A0ABQ9YC89_9EUKA|nr:putative Tubulin polyglutamylase TTLL13 [Blattamonas nauphoetae]
MEVDFPNQPDPNLPFCDPQTRKAKHPCVDVEGCRYDIARAALNNLQYCRCRKHEHVRLYYLDTTPQVETLTKLSPSQTMTKFPHMAHCSQKAGFFQHLNRMRLCYPDEYNFIPRTWVLPQDKAELIAEFNLQKTRKTPNTYIVKPSSGTQGVGIYLVQDIESIRPSTEQIIVQEYLNRPFLIDGLKFDLRVYVLVSSVADPNPISSSGPSLWVWLGKEGLARFCTKKYNDNITKQSLSEVFMHLTNYAVNKTSKDFVGNEEAGSDDKGSKRSLSSITRLLHEQGHDTDALWAKISSVLVKTMLALHPSLLSVYATHCAQPTEAQSGPYRTEHSQCWQMLGFDVMLDADLNPFVIEINHAASFVTDSPLDTAIKYNVIHSALTLMDDLNMASTSSEDGTNRSILESQGGFYRQIYPMCPSSLNGVSLASWMSEGLTHTPPPSEEQKSVAITRSPFCSVVDTMGIFNYAALHHTFYRLCGVKPSFGLSIIANVGPCISAEYKLYLQRCAESAKEAPDSAPATKAKAGRDARPSSSSLPPPRAHQPYTTNASRFCQFGRNSGLTQLLRMTQADFDTLFRHVTRSSGRVSAVSGSGKVQSPSSTTRDARTKVGAAPVNSASQTQMGYGEWCQAALQLALRKSEGATPLDACLHFISFLEEDLLKTEITERKPIVSRPSSMKALPPKLPN